CSPSAAQLARDERRDDDADRAGDDREHAESDERVPEQEPRERGQQRRDGRELHVAALQVPPRDGVVELVALPPVAVREAEIERGLERDDDENRSPREAGHASADKSRSTSARSL